MHAHAHVHDQPPSDAHALDQRHERYSDRAHDRHVVLELGGGIGALIVTTGPDLLGAEVEISPAGHDDRRSHKEVLERVTAAGSMYVLVFDGIPEGAYSLWVDDVARARNVRIAGGAIAELDWRAA